MSILQSLLALLLLPQPVVPLQRIVIPGWVAISGPPTEEELRCTYFSEDCWALSVKDGRIIPVPCPIREHADPLPFSYSSGPDRKGKRSVRRLRDGWLVGFDDGEFGGGLWCFSPDGRESRRLRPPADAPASPADPFRAENVRGLPTLGTEQLVLMGLDHLGGRSGRVFRIVSQEGAWELAPVAVLDSQPDSWFVDGEQLLIVTETGIWELQLNGDLTKLLGIEIRSLSTSTLIRGPDQALYLGLRHYILRLEQKGGEWLETWFVPSNCQHVRYEGERCICAPESQ